jgi:hypothetical protein
VTKNKFVQASRRAGANSTSKKIAGDSKRSQQRQQQQQQQPCGNSKYQPGAEPRSKSLHEQQQQQQAAPESERSNIVSGASFLSTGEESHLELEQGSTLSSY